MHLPALPSSATPAVHTDRDHALSDSARERVVKGVAANTTKAYKHQWTEFTAWCAEQGRVPLPATPETLAEYVNHLADTGKGPATMEQALAVISVQHQTANYPKGFPDTTGARKAIRTVKRERAGEGKRVRQAPPVTVDVLRKMIDTTDPDTPIGKRDRVLLLLGLAMMARRSELVDLQISHVSEDDNGLLVLIAMSKTDQDATGVEVAVPYGSHPDTDPVRAVRAWLAVLAEHGVTSGPLLRAVDRHGRISPDGITTDSVSRIVRRLAVAAVVPNAEKYTAHSLRAGGATSSYQAGIPVGTIAKHGRWSPNSPVVLSYIRAVDRWSDNAMRGVL